MKMLTILKKKTFLSVFVAQFFGALNDNLFRAALAGFVTYKLFDISSESKQIIVSLAVGIFMLPFFLFSALAGGLADKYPKDIIFKVAKFCEIIIALLASYGFWIRNPYFLLVVLFFMGTHSAFFGPAKYSILPDILAENELIAGNGLFEAGSYLAILQGIVIGGLTMSGNGSGLLIISLLMSIIASLGFVASMCIPRLKAIAPQSQLNWNWIKLTFDNLKFAVVRREILLCILGISWFWMIGAALISQIPSFSQNVLNANSNVYIFLLTMFSCGIGTGAAWCQLLLKGEISGRYVPLSAIMMTIFLGDLAFSSFGIDVGGKIQGLRQFITSGVGIRISLDLLFLSMCGGLYMIPLNAMLQVFSDEKIRSRVIATNNIINALFMVIGSGICVLLLSQGISIAGIFLTMAVANAVVTLYICGLMPEHFIRSLIHRVLKLIYWVNLRGLDNFKQLKAEAVIISNHASFLDAVLLWVYLPGVSFAINTHIAKKWWIKPFLNLIKYFSIDPMNPMAVRNIIEEVRRGHKVVIFPEGRITTTGGLMKVYPGPAMIADKSGAAILQVYIDGSQYSIFGRFSRNFRKRPYSKIDINILPPCKLEIDFRLVGKIRRLKAAAKLYDIMSHTKFISSNIDINLFESLVNALKLVGRRKVVLEDISRRPVSFGRVMTGIFVLGEVIAKHTVSRERLGFMLPNSSAAAMTFFGMQLYGRIPCMLNFSGGLKNILASCKIAQVKKVYTSEEFIKRAHLESIVNALRESGLEIIYLENIQSAVSAVDKIKGLFRSFQPMKHVTRVNPDEEAVVMFTSGSEGVPKGVVLSHRNLQSNCAQIRAVVDLGLLDSFFNAMPIFHSFGLTVGMLLPLLGGIKVFMYPSPLHYKIIPELVYDTNSTIIFGTDTFFRGYAKVAHPYDFYSVRLAVAGAEKIKEETFKVWFEHFGIRVLEGYGATEASPVLSINLPMNFKLGTAGRFLPGIDADLEMIPGIENGGRLKVRGPNIMIGYLRIDNPGILQPVKDGWYDTGDVVNIDDQGFVEIKGRAKRFAKIAGEMVSLSAVEMEITNCWQNGTHAIIAAPDDMKGELLILFTTVGSINRSELRALFKKIGISELSVPKKIIYLKQLPLTGTGKIDYPKLGEMVNVEKTVFLNH